MSSANSLGGYSSSISSVSSRLFCATFSPTDVIRDFLYKASRRFRSDKGGGGCYADFGFFATGVPGIDKFDRSLVSSWFSQIGAGMKLEFGKFSILTLFPLKSGFGFVLKLCTS